MSLLLGDKLTAENLAILDCALEGVMVADAHCIIRYINPAYLRMTGFDAQIEIGRELNPTPPYGPLREAITSGKGVYGCRYQPRGSKAELIVNAAPIVIEGKVTGGVSFCQDISDILCLTRKLAKTTQLVQSLTERLAVMGEARYTFDDIVGESEVLHETRKMSAKAAQGTSTVLLLGESGTGKELFAQAIHNASKRSNQPFVTVNCAAVPENLLESEFFGHEKGAFTGAQSRKIGLFERADGGTLFLDEIGDMSLVLQAKILRALQDGEITRVGGDKSIKVDVRVIAATNRDLENLVRESKFRQDLFFRLNVVCINIPSLGRRKEDIPLLTEHILARLNRKLGRQVQYVDRHAMQKLCAYQWPGNIRELQNVLERAVNLAEDAVIGQEQLLLPELRTVPVREALPVPGSNSMTLSLAEQEKMAIRQALALYGTTVQGKTRAAQSLGISLATLYKRLKQLE